MRSNRRIYISCALVFGAAILTVASDATLSEFFHQTMKPWDSALQWISTLGDGRLVAGLILFSWALPWCKGAYRSRLPILAGLSASLAFLVVQVLKVVFGRPRPYLLGEAKLGSFHLGSFSWLNLDADFSSFPSGHAAVGFALAWVLWRRWPNAFSRGLVPAFTLLVAFSRVALAKHFLSDVVAAAALGVMCGQLVLDRFQGKPVVISLEQLKEAATPAREAA